MRAKVGLLELAKQLGKVSQACKTMGFSRHSFYRFKELYETGGAVGQPHARGRGDHPRADAYGRPASPTKCKLGHSVSPAGVRGVWQRHDLETMKKG